MDEQSLNHWYDLLLLFAISYNALEEVYFSKWCLRLLTSTRDTQRQIANSSSIFLIFINILKMIMMQNIILSKVYEYLKKHPFAFKECSYYITFCL